MKVGNLGVVLRLTVSNIRRMNVDADAIVYVVHNLRLTTLFFSSSKFFRSTRNYKDEAIKKKATLRVS